jgi:riboflavin synthase
MFSGIVEELGRVVSKESIQSNIRLGISCTFLDELKVDQSVSHNGVCLTIVEKSSEQFFVDIISESLDKSNLGDLNEGDFVNLERSVRLNDRLDGHIVQGHVDQTAVVKDVQNQNGSWVFSKQ